MEKKFEETLKEETEKLAEDLKEILDQAKQLEDTLVKAGLAIKALEESVKELSATIENHEVRIKNLEDRLAALEQDVNKEITTLATALLGAGTILSLGAVYFIFGNRFFPVDTRRSYQHVYIKDGVSKVRHTKSQHKK
jgi:ABC-type transporter Mla subunit MlaD